MNIIQSQDMITIEINNKDDLDKITNMELNLLLPQGQHKKNRNHGRAHSRTEPLVVCEVPAKVHTVIPIKEATVKVNSVTASLIKHNK